MKTHDEKILQDNLNKKPAFGSDAHSSSFISCAGKMDHFVLFAEHRCVFEMYVVVDLYKEINCVKG